MKKHENVLKLCIMAMLTALSVVLATTIHTPLLPPPLNFLLYDPADIPVLTGAMMLGPISGILVLLVTSAIQAMMPDGSGIIGFFMHFIASSALVLLASLIYRKKKTIKSLIIGLVLGTLAMTVVMIPLNLVLTGVFMGAGIEAVVDLLPAIILFNLLKAGINSVITFAVFTPISHALKKYIKVGKK